MFKVIIDSGKPYEINVQDTRDVLKELAGITEEEKEYTDVTILENGIDVTEEFIVVD